MAIGVNNFLSWVTPYAVHVNDNGTWRYILEIYVNDNGTWRPVFAPAFTVVSGTNGIEFGYDRGNFGQLLPIQNISSAEIELIIEGVGLVQVTVQGTWPQSALYSIRNINTAQELFGSLASHSNHDSLTSWTWTGALGMTTAGASVPLEIRWFN